MTTKRKPRNARRRVPANVTAEYLEELRCRAFLEASCPGVYDDPLTEEEEEILRPYEEKRVDAYFTAIEAGLSAGREP